MNLTGNEIEIVPPKISVFVNHYSKKICQGKLKLSDSSIEKYNKVFLTAQTHIIK